jgi:hypothetical protein
MNYAKIELVYVPVKFQESPPVVLFDEETIVITRSFKGKAVDKALEKKKFTIGPWKIPFGFNYIRLTLDLDKYPDKIEFMRPVYEGIPDSGVVIVHPGAKADIDVNLDI